MDVVGTHGGCGSYGQSILERVCRDAMGAGFGANRNAVGRVVEYSDGRTVPSGTRDHEFHEAREQAGAMRRAVSAPPVETTFR